jgi:hypothetical protein
MARSLQIEPPEGLDSQAENIKMKSDVESQTATSMRGHNFLLFPHWLHISLLFIPNVYRSRVSHLDIRPDLAHASLFGMADRELWSTWALPDLPREGKVFLYHLLELEKKIHSPQDEHELPPPFFMLGVTWKEFIRGLVQEWQTLNLVSAILVPSVLH